MSESKLDSERGSKTRQVNLTDSAHSAACRMSETPESIDPIGDGNDDDATRNRGRVGPAVPFVVLEAAK